MSKWYSYLHRYLHRHHRRRPHRPCVHWHCHCCRCAGRFRDFADNRCAHRALCKYIAPAHSKWHAAWCLTMVSISLHRCRSLANANSWKEINKNAIIEKMQSSNPIKLDDTAFEKKQSHRRSKIPGKAIQKKQSFKRSKAKKAYLSVIYNVPEFNCVWFIFISTFSNFFTKPSSGDTNGPIITILESLSLSAFFSA